MPDQQHIDEELDQLIQICRDGEEAYREGAEHAKAPELKRLLYQVSVDRAKFAGELERLGARWGRKVVERTGTAGGALRRGWTDLKVDLGGGDDAILSAIESSDEYARKRYDEAIKDHETPEEVVGILRNQAQAIVGTLDRVRALRAHRKVA